MQYKPAETDEIYDFQTFESIEFTKIFQLKGLKPKNKGHINFYECCDLTEKVYLVERLKSSVYLQC